MILLIILLGMTVLILGIITILLYKLTTKSAADGNNKSLDDMAMIIRLEYEEKERINQETRLMEYANNKLKNTLPILPMTSNEQGDRPVRVGSQKRELVPFNLREDEKRLWEEFNS